MKSTMIYLPNELLKCIELYKDKSSKVEVIRKFNKMMVSDERLESTLLPSVDGFTIARVK